MDDEIKLVAPELIENCKCENITFYEVPKMIELGKKMIEFCAKNGGVGLACPQIGVYKKMFVYRKTEASFQIVINPTFYPVSKRQIKVLEGCMSYPSKSFLVPRYKEIQAVFYVFEQEKLIKRGYDLIGNKAIVFQHENLHLGKYGTDDLGMTIKQYGVPQVGQGNEISDAS
jgi:peptide deformylase